MTLMEWSGCGNCGKNEATCCVKGWPEELPVTSTQIVRMFEGLG